MQVRAYPRKVFSVDERFLSFHDLGLRSKSEALFLEFVEWLIWVLLFLPNKGKGIMEGCVVYMCNCTVYKCSNFVVFISQLALVERCVVYMCTCTVYKCSTFVDITISWFYFENYYYVPSFLAIRLREVNLTPSM